MDDEDREFFRWYGDWAPLDPPGLAAFMAGFSRRWWIVGGWSIEAFTGVTREHDDIDVSILACDMPAFREFLGDRWTPWHVDTGTLRPWNDRFPDVHPERQVWIRQHSGAPWIIDLPITPDTDGLWTNKRWPEHVAPVDEVTWVASDAIRYLAPEITLLIKAKLDRAKDLRDLDATWPLLPPDRQAWLRDSLAHLHPDHPWLARL
ncbi:MAG: hypothetical protein WKF79_09955 [Nocardioides sp.]